jgi:hypothetical protein
MFMFMEKDFKLTQLKITAILHLKKYSNLKEKINQTLLIWPSDGIMKHI